jgi:rare lipoprotein A
MMICLLKLLILPTLFILTACQTTKEVVSSEQNQGNIKTTEIKDSAPLGPIPTFFKAIIPKSEPLSPYGNPASYKVYGKVYRVMTSSYGYKERGLASWYASKFHKQRTSSGEPYDMYALTAAHRTLPLPTYLKVKNLDNGRQIIVKVNDRGPFHSGRLIDLSYGASVKLGIFPKGTAHVEIEAIQTKAPGAPLKSGRYFIQAGAFQSRANALQLQTKIRRLTRSPVVLESIQRRYVVKLGPFVNQAQAEQVKKMLRQHGASGAFVILR